MDIQVKTKNVHNKTLFNKIDAHIDATIKLFDLSIELDIIVSLIEMLLSDEANAYNLEQINVVGDSRNNKASMTNSGLFKIDISYKHVNCFNTTTLLYSINTE